MDDVCFIDYDISEGDYFPHEEWGWIVLILLKLKLYFKQVAAKWYSGLWKWLAGYEYLECRSKYLYTPVLQVIVANIEKVFEDYLQQVQKLA